MKSMTGYGHYAYSSDGFSIEGEIKSYNNRYLDISRNISVALQIFEQYIDSEIRKAAGRGHIEITLRLKLQESDISVNLDKGILHSYMEAYRDIEKETGCSPSFSDYAAIADLIVHDRSIEPEMYREGVEKTLSECLRMLSEAKKREGEGTQRDLEKLGHEFEASLASIEARSDELEAHYDKLLREKISMLSADIDRNIFMTELGALLVRYSINEEVSRLRVHLAEYWRLIASEGPVGKKLDFLAQEMQRECNTIASKSQLVEINLAVVSMKDNIEDIREQIRNIE